ncbi:MAG TPA: biotin/lipoyl-binding protein [Candidatus Cloacimonetes bacterium]|jgi:biotin carboxyl carrier protein|nr:acetyl-CoA carboxylase biotin carboxyl carrier protein subunit [Candidatus Cloacimonas sp.]HHZ15973.1 biotin/lipoyl-binding protein [Candidatus Cloacimonadota bacterium]
MKTYKLKISGEIYEAKVVEYTDEHAKVNVNGTDYTITFIEDDTRQVPKLASQEKAVPIAPTLTSGFEAGTGELRAPIPGVIHAIKVKEGDKVTKGQTLLLLEAMKMETEIAAPMDGVIKEIKIKERELVKEGDLMILIQGDEVKPAPAPKPAAKPAASAPAPAAPVKTDTVMYAPLPGLVVDVFVEVGQQLNIDDRVLVLEAMKMESDIFSTLKGRIKKVYVKNGDSVQEGEPLVEVEG